ncbi:hypothetical protein EDB85DRAFT_1935916, partial [Lactarius pseudohatsudake]
MVFSPKACPVCRRTILPITQGCNVIAQAHPTQVQPPLSPSPPAHEVLDETSLSESLLPHCMSCTVRSARNQARRAMSLTSFFFWLMFFDPTTPAHCVGVPLGCKAFGGRPVERESPPCAQQEAHSLRPSLRRVLRRCGGSIPCIVVFRIHIIDPIL